MMVGNTAVIGMPNSGVVEKYFLGGTQVDRVTALDDQFQTLEAGEIQQNETHTVLNYQRKLVESEMEKEIDPSVPQIFIFAIGRSNNFGVHGQKGAFRLTLQGCVNREEVTDDSVGDDMTDDGTDDMTGDDSMGETDDETVPDAPIEDPEEDPEGCSFSEPQFIFPDGSLILEHYANLDDETVTFRMTYAGQAWLGLGISRFGLMQGSDAMIGTLADGVRKYDLEETNLAGVVLSEEQTLTGAWFRQNDTHTMMRFTKPMREAGDMPLSATARNTFIYAIGTGNNLMAHRRAGAFRTTLNTCLEDAGTETDDDTGDHGHSHGGTVSKSAYEQVLSDNRNLFKAHDIMMGVAFTVLIPLAIGVSMMRHLIPMDGMWLELHKWLNLFAFATFMAAFGLAVKAIQRVRDIPGSTEEHFRGEDHKVYGITIYCMVVVQLLLGLLRPKRAMPIPRRVLMTRKTNLTPQAPAPTPSPAPAPEPDILMDPEPTDEQLVAELDRLNGEPQDPPPSAEGSIADEDEAEEAAAEDEEEEAVADKEEQTQGTQDGNQSSVDSASSSSESEYIEEYMEQPKQSNARLLWEVLHPMFGFTTVGLAWYTCYLGIEEYAELYEERSGPGDIGARPVVLCGWLCGADLLDGVPPEGLACDLVFSVRGFCCCVGRERRPRSCIYEKVSSRHSFFSEYRFERAPLGAEFSTDFLLFVIRPTDSIQRPWPVPSPPTRRSGAICSLGTS